MRPGQVLLGGLVCWVGGAWLVGLHNALPLAPDEAQYLSWSWAPAWGYYSKPPLLAWLIALSTQLLGSSEQAVRVLSPVLYALAATGVYLAGKRLFDARTALFGALTYLCLPVVSLGTQFMTTDAPLHAAWGLALWLFVRAEQEARLRDWIWLGVMLGLGLLAKYSMFFLVLSAALYLLIDRQRRRLFARPGPWLAVLVAASLFLPNLLWNAARDFASFRHTAEISQLDRGLFHPAAFGEFLGAQFGVFGPLSLALLAIVVWQARGRKLPASHVLLACFTLLPLATFLGLALLSRAFANWASFAYPAGALWLAAALLGTQRTAWLWRAWAVNILLIVLILFWRDILPALDIPLTRKNDPYARALGWPALGHAVQTRLAQHPGTTLLLDDRKSMAELLYYGSANARYFDPENRRNEHYALLYRLDATVPGDYLLVSRQPYTEAALRRHFVRIQPLQSIDIPVMPGLVLGYGVWRVASEPPAR